MTTPKAVLTPSGLVAGNPDFFTRFTIHKDVPAVVTGLGVAVPHVVEPYDIPPAQGPHISVLTGVPGQIGGR